MSKSTELVQPVVLLLAIAMTIVAAVRVLRQASIRQKGVKLRIGRDKWNIDPSALPRERMANLLSFLNFEGKFRIGENPAGKNYKPSKLKRRFSFAINITSPRNANRNLFMDRTVREAAGAAALAVDPSLSEYDLERVVRILVEDPTADEQLPVIFKPIAQLLSLISNTSNTISSTRSKDLHWPYRKHFLAVVKLAQRFSFAVMLIVIGFYAAAKGGALPNPVQDVAHHIINVPSAVTGRASRPTQINANGIEFTTGYLDVNVHGHSVRISARDWNTITDDSVVAHNIGVILDPTIHPSGTSNNRFQYLADRMLPFVGSTFGTIGVVSTVKKSSNVVIAAIINPTSDTYKLSDLTLRVIDSSPSTTISASKFYSTTGTALVIPSKTIYFARLSSPAIAKTPSHATSTTFNFGWTEIYDCGHTVCPAPSS